MSFHPSIIRTAAAALALGLFAWLPAGCLPYIYHDRDTVLIDNLDVDQTLEVAECELLDGGFGSVLTVWAMRDQRVTENQALWISELYFQYIGSIEEGGASGVNVWHLTWAISNLYRLGDPGVQRALLGAYTDAGKRVEQIDAAVVYLHFDDDKIYMGDAHGGGRAYAEGHLVVPGNPDYLQSALEYHMD